MKKKLLNTCFCFKFQIFFIFFLVLNYYNYYEMNRKMFDKCMAKVKPILKLYYFIENKPIKKHLEFYFDLILSFFNKISKKLFLLREIFALFYNFPFSIFAIVYSNCHITINLLRFSK